MRNTLLLICFLLLFCKPGSSQEINWHQFDTAIANKRNLIFLNDTLEQIKNAAQLNQQLTVTARCWYYQLKIADLKSEDTAYFNNGYFIDSLLGDQSTPPLMQSIMHIMLAKRIAGFRHQFFYKSNKNLFYNRRLKTDYTKLSQSSLDSIVQVHFEIAKTISLQLKNTSVSDLLWLASDPLVFLFKPDFTDIICAEQISYHQIANKAVLGKSNRWLELSPADFFRSDSIPNGIHLSSQLIYTLYRQWSQLHASNPDAYYFIESLARQFFFQQYASVEGSAKLYEHYLKTNSLSQYATVKTHAIYQLVLYWNELGNKYSNANQYNRWSNYNEYNSNYDSSYRWYFKKIQVLIESNNQLLDSFYYLKQQLQQLQEQYRKPLLKIEHSNYYIPGESIKTKVYFKNVQTVYFKIVTLSSYDYIINQKKLRLGDLLLAKTLINHTVQLPVSIDYQEHATEIKLPALPLGYYAVLYSNSPLDSANKTTAFFTLHSSNMAVINNDSRVFVLHRKIGLPLVGAKLQVVYKHTSNTKTYNTKTNQQGYSIIHKNDIKNVFVMNGADTITATLNTPSEKKPDEVFDKEEEDLMEYYEDNIKLHLFTDRAIYRPGQKVHYKGIFIIKHPKTGESIVLNKHNLKFSWLRKIVDKEVKDLAKGKFDLYIQNPFGKTMDTIHLQCNDYGSFAGQYNIDEKAATGEWEFDTDYIDIEYANNGRFKVEEYKRPSFELTIDKPTAFLQLGDSFFVKIQVKSFTGAQLSNVKIKYDVEADFSIDTIDVSNGKELTEWKNESIIDSSGSSNNNGELLIKVPANFLRKYHFSNNKKQEVEYSVHAMAIDATGESHEGDLTVTLDNRPVKINFTVAEIYEQSALKELTVSTKSIFSGNLKKQLEVIIYKKADQPIADEEDRQTIDFVKINNEWIYTPSNIRKQHTKEVSNIVYSTFINTDTGQFIWPKSILQTGNYTIEILCKENGQLIGERTADFAVFDNVNNSFPADKSSFNYLPVNTAAKGESIKWYNGNTAKINYAIYHAQYFATTRKGVVLKYWYDVKTDSKTLNEWEYTIPSDAVDDIKLTHIYVLNNKLFKETVTVYVAKAAATMPEIIVEQYRKKLVPGSKETFVVSIKTSNENIAAELMTTMYDASLEKIENHVWNVPNKKVRYYSKLQWDEAINGLNTNYLFNYSLNIFGQLVTNKTAAPLWWINPLDYAYNELNNNNFSRFQNGNPGALNALQGRVAGVSIIGNSALNEVVVVGYGTAKRDVTGSMALIKIRGATSIGSYNIPLVIVDGIPYEGDLSKIDPASVTDGIVLKGADAVALYGSRANNGVILLSTKGLLQFPAPEEPAVVVRKNFEETAFFLPQVYAGTDGLYHINFTIPESVTEWNWKMLAHTKNAQFFYLQKTIVTQLPLMVQPNMPRYLYQGDVINLQIRITNLDSTMLNGTSNCSIEDVVTGENITASVLSASKQNFSVGKKSNISIAHSLHIPENLLHPIKIKITGKAGSFSDGEEYVIPILSTKALVSKSLPFVLANHLDTIIHTPDLPADAQAYGIGMHITPKPQAAVINALPYLANYPYNCAEQTFNKMLAYSTAIKMIQSDTAARNTMKQLEATTVSSKPVEGLPDELSEQTMPWLQLNHSTQIHQKQLLQLFDTLRSKQQIEKYINDVAALQNADGGVAWFTGGKSSIYISNYLLQGFGKLKADSLPFLVNERVKEKYNRLLPKLIQFCDESLGAVTAGMQTNLFHLNARRLWLKDFKLSEDNKKKADSILNTAWKNIDKLPLNEQALLIITSLGYKDADATFYKRATTQLESIRQLAISENVNGLRWKDLSNADDFASNDEETIANLAMAFEENGNSTAVVKGIIQWLLQAKEQHSWSTTKATAAIVGVLIKQQQSVTGSPINLNADVQLQVTDNMLSGQLFSFKQLSAFPTTITVYKNTDVTAKGGFNFYYLTSTPPVNETYSGVIINKQLQLLNSNQQWQNIDNTTSIKIADKIRTIITINTPKQLKYVLIDEKRPACLEPVDGSSGYEYNRTFSYYQSVRDAGHQFFAEQIPSGISTIVYETIVSKEGTFSNGQISLQCMYQPAIRAYAGGGVIKVHQ